MFTKEEAKQRLTELIEKHQRHKNEGKFAKINEENTKEYIDELFRILGWDFTENVTKEYGTGKRRRVDYAFQMDGTTKFLVEAKAYNEELDEKYIKQTLEYGYQNNKTWVILTNFRELRIYNAKYYDKEEHIRRLFEPLRIEDAIIRLDDLWVLSKEGMKDNLINQLANKYGKVKPKEAIDSLIFEDLLRWRRALEEGIKEHERLNRLPIDPNAAEKHIDEAVQKILDRIIFVRVCEDRGLEEEELLRWCVKEWKADKKISLMSYLSRLFSKKNGEYNSGIFAPHYSETLTIENEALETIIEESYVNTNGLTYDFSAIDADILGTIYENYLAYIQKRVWDKESKQKSKRKAQGIYYTPTYIVDYIVKNTLGEKLKECKKPEEALKIKVLDPACGSGSFLIRAYDEFKNWYNNHMKKHGEKQHTLNQDLKGATEFMDKVLENCIYGVDLDPKAVEIAQVNLLLKAAEGKHKLPTLNHTVQCGNSLIDDPAVAGERAFTWEDKFTEVFRNGGFDVVVGNPPYIFARDKSFSDIEKKYYYRTYKLQKYQINTYGLFVERSYNLIQQKSKFGFIIPNNWLTIETFSDFRKFILDNCAKLHVVNIYDKVFEEANVDTCLLLFEKNKPTQIELAEMIEGKINLIGKFEQTIFEKNNGVINISLLKNMELSDLLRKIENKSIPLSQITEVSTGLKAYQIGKGVPKQTKEAKENRKFHATQKISTEYLPYLEGRDVIRYILLWSGEYLRYGDHLAEPRKSVPFKGLRILVRQIPSKLPHCINSVLTDREVLHDINSMVIFNPNNVDLRVILAVINSKLVSYWFFNKFGKLQRKLFPQFKVKELKSFPIPKEIGTSKKESLIKLVDKMLSLNKQLSELKNSNEAQKLKVEIEKTDAEIDRLVYELYSLTEEEIKIVEESLK